MRGNSLFRLKAVSAGCVFAAVAIELFPVLTGYGVHEWAGVAACAILLTHAALSLRAGANKVDMALDLAVLSVLAVCAVSGALVSGAVLPAFGLYASAGFFVWSPVHAMSAKVLTALLLVHAVSHGRTIAAMWRHATAACKAPSREGRE